MYRSLTFDWKRFCRYFSFDFQQAFRRHWLITLLAGLVPMFHFTVIGLLAILSGSEQWNTHLSVNDMILATVSVSYFLMTPILLYGKITDRAEGAVLQLLPASHCEKYVSTILNSIVLFPLAFTAVYLGTDWLMTVLFPAHTESSIISRIGMALIRCESTERANTLEVLMMSKFFLPYMVSSAGLCGAVLFKRNKGSKTFLTAILSFVVLIVIIAVIAAKVMGPAVEFLDRNLQCLWHCFQTAAAVCCLIYVYFKTRKIQL